MSSKENLEEKILASIHNELEQAEQNKLQDELEADSDLKSYQLEMKKLHQHLKQAPKISMPLHRTKEIMAIANKKKNGNILYTFVAAAALIFAMTYLFKGIPSKTEIDTTTHSQQSTTGQTSYFDQAYNWLQTKQTIEGNWVSSSTREDDKYATGLTGLSLLALVDKKTKSPEDLQAIKKAATWLKKHQDQSGRFGPDINNHLYNHGIATYAVLKANNLLDPSLKPNIEKALQFIVNNQSTQGGWGYSNEPDSINTSITVWQLQSLLLAKKLSLADNYKAIQSGFTWIRSISDKNGIPGYRKQNDYPYGKQALTAMSGVFFQHHNELGIDAIEARISFQNELDQFAKLSPEDINYYQCYFIADNLKHFKVKDQLAFEKQIRLTLKQKQVQTGQSLGSWNPDDIWGHSGGRIYSTTMALMALNCLN